MKLQCSYIIERVLWTVSGISLFGITESGSLKQIVASVEIQSLAGSAESVELEVVECRQTIFRSGEMALHCIGRHLNHCSPG